MFSALSAYFKLIFGGITILSDKALPILSDSLDTVGTWTSVAKDLSAVEAQLMKDIAAVEAKAELKSVTDKSKA